jgi:hypothetical protein
MWEGMLITSCAFVVPAVLHVMPSLSHPTIKAYVALIGMKIAHTYFQGIYCKVKQWIQRNESYNQIKMCMCVDMRSGVVEVVMNGVNGNGENLILLLELGNNFVRKHGLSYSSLFFRRALEYPLF